jgi:hypothetical protein
MSWNAFLNEFYHVMRSVSPGAFEQQWRVLLEKYPVAADYLQDSLYPCRQQWAWTWLCMVYTCGVFGTARSEAENKDSKKAGGPKTLIVDVFSGLNDRTIAQLTKEQTAVREVSSEV